MSEKAKIDPQKAKEMQERARERNLILKELKNGSMTVEELSKASGIDKPKVLKHLNAMTQFGKVQVLGERQNQYAYCLPPEKKA